MDIEGAEHEVLRDLAASSKIDNVDRMVMEYHNHVSAEEDRLAGVLNLLESHGFGCRLVANSVPRSGRPQSFPLRLP
jgi:hypothetical protein